MLESSRWVNLGSDLILLSFGFLTCQRVVPTIQAVVRIEKGDAGKALGIVLGIH